MCIRDRYFYIDCGTADNALIGANREAVAALHEAGAAYEYHETAGAHSWDYWDRRIREFLPLLMKRLANGGDGAQRSSTPNLRSFVLFGV